jgi:hypothetical protein
MNGFECYRRDLAETRISPSNKQKKPAPAHKQLSLDLDLINRDQNGT